MAWTTNRGRRSAAVLLTAVMAVFLSCCAGSPRPAEPTEVRVVSLGDSIARGYGCQPEEAYGALLAEHLRGELPADRFTVRFLNNGVDGDTTGDLLRRLETGEVRRAVEEADVVTLSIGGNNLLHWLRDELCALFDLDPASPTLADELAARFAGAGPVEAAQELAPLGALLTDKELPVRAEESVEVFRDQAGQVLEAIRESNSDALVLVTTIPNPVGGGPLGALCGLMLNAYNESIRALPESGEEGLLVADSAAAFKEYTGDQPLSFAKVGWEDLGNWCLDPHPTPLGQSLMAQAHYPLVREFVDAFAARTASGSAVMSDDAAEGALVPQESSAPMSDEERRIFWASAVSLLLAVAGGFLLLRKRPKP